MVPLEPLLMTRAGAGVAAAVPYHRGPLTGTAVGAMVVLEQEAVGAVAAIGNMVDDMRRGKKEKRSELRGRSMGDGDDNAM